VHNDGGGEGPEVQAVSTYNTNERSEDSTRETKGGQTDKTHKTHKTEQKQKANPETAAPTGERTEGPEQRGSHEHARGQERRKSSDRGDGTALYYAN
jgi:hypothetical protein